MRPRNSQGTPVDPVPFLVVAITGFAVLYSFGPMYLVAVGLSLPAATVVTTVAFVAATALAYYRYVWRSRPARRGAVPGRVRMQRLYYALAVAFAALVLLALPLLVG